MKSLVSVGMIGAALTAFTATPAMAQGLFGWVFNIIGGNRGHAGGNSGGTVVSVPEIDAASGLLAIAAVLAATLLVWERRRRARA